MNYIYDDHTKTYKDEYRECMNCDFTNNVFNMPVEIIEDNNIDIEEIETYSEDGIELYDKHSIHFNRKKINELVRKYNELNRKIKELKEK